jgi:hypothetical protein
MLRARLRLAVIFLLCASCRTSKQPVPLVVHVWRDPSATFAYKLMGVDLQFTSTKPHLKSGTGIIVGTTASGFQGLLEKMIRDGVDKYRPEILILESEADVPAGIRQQLGSPQSICGPHPAFIPTPVCCKQAWLLKKSIFLKTTEILGIEDV